MCLFGGYVLVLMGAFFSLSASDRPNVRLDCLDGSEIYVGQKIPVDEKIHQEIEKVTNELESAIRTKIYVTVPFNTFGLSRFMHKLKMCTQYGAGVNVIANTRMLRKPDGKESIDVLANSGSADVKNTTKVHGKDFLVIKKESSDPNNVSGILISGSSNIGSKAAAKRNEEVCTISTEPKALIAAEKVLQSYAQYAHTYNGNEIKHTPEKDRLAREKLLEKGRVARTPSNLVALQVTSTVETDIKASRENIVAADGVTSVYCDSMTGCPDDFLKKVKDGAAVRVYTDIEGVIPHEARWHQLAQKDNMQILVRIGDGIQHSKTLGVRRIALDGTNIDMVITSSANVSDTSAEDFNTFIAKKVESLSPIRERFEKLHAEATNLTPHKKPSVVVYNPKSPQGGKSLRDAIEKRKLMRSNSAQKRKLAKPLVDVESPTFQAFGQKRKAVTVDADLPTSPAKVKKISEASSPTKLTTDPTVIITTTTTTTTTTPTAKRKLNFGE